LIDEYLWGAIYTRPDLDLQSRALCALSAMTVMGQYDRQIRRRIEGALRVGVTPKEIMELFFHLILYGGYINSRTAIRVARSVFTEQGLSA
jgi:4-carboxymuconolactone decarboxylase